MSDPDAYAEQVDQDDGIEVEPSEQYRAAFVNIYIDGPSMGAKAIVDAIFEHNDHWDDYISNSLDTPNTIYVVCHVPTRDDPLYRTELLSSKIFIDEEIFDETDPRVNIFAVLARHDDGAREPPGQFEQLYTRANLEVLIPMAICAECYDSETLSDVYPDGVSLQFSIVGPPDDDLFVDDDGFEEDQL